MQESLLLPVRWLIDERSCPKDVDDCTTLMG
jgi:hypothetical protein